jgi:hypothetical protein
LAKNRLMVSPFETMAPSPLTTAVHVCLLVGVPPVVIY